MPEQSGNVPSLDGNEEIQNQMDADIDVEELARRVFDMLVRELMLENERTGKF